jgi:hypothetical protein
MYPKTKALAKISYMYYIDIIIFDACIKIRKIICHSILSGGVMKKFSTNRSHKIAAFFCALILIPSSKAIAYTDVGLDSTQTGVSTAVQWMFDNHIPYSRMEAGPGSSMEWPVTVRYPNPGLWTYPLQKDGSTVESWTAKPFDPSSGLGSTIPPYPRRGEQGAFWYWYQLRITSISHDTLYSFYPTYDQNTALSKGFVIGNNLLPPPDGDGIRGIEAGGQAFRLPNNTWEYQYWFANHGANDVSFEFQLSEDARHQGIHDEFAFLELTKFSYDKPRLTSAISPHNYDWRYLTLAPGDYVMVGFSDIHSPSLDSWNLRDDTGALACTSSCGRFPVPTIPEPGAWAMMLGGLFLISLVKRLQFRNSPLELA